MVLILYTRIKAHPNTIKEWWTSVFKAQQFSFDANMQIEVVDKTAEAAEQEIIVDKFWGSEKASFQVQYAGRPLYVDGPRLPNVSEIIHF